MNDGIHDPNAAAAGKDMAQTVILCALIKHHPNREAVLATLRQAHLMLPAIAGEDPKKQEAGQIFHAYMEMIREMERTLPV